MAIKILIVENEGLFRDMLQSVMEEQPDIEVVGAVGDGQSAVLLARDLSFDVVLMDIQLGPGPSGIETGVRIKEIHPDVGIVLLSMHKEKDALAYLPPHAAKGWSYLLKPSVANVEALARAIQGAAAGFMVVDPELTRDMHPRTGSKLNGLTARQAEVLRLLAQGYSNRAIAELLSVSTKSVENYINGLYQELGVSRDDAVHPRVQAVLTYLRESAPSASP